MKLSQSLAIKPFHPLQLALFVIIELLLVFGNEVSKFNLYQSIYLYDVIYLAMGLVGLLLFLRRSDRWWVGSILIMLTISLAYLIYSWVVELGPPKYIARHYARKRTA